MGPLSTAARRLALLATLGLLLALLFAAPAAAHTELVNTTPANGAQLARSPTAVRMEFSESVNLIDNGIRLIDGRGGTVPTADPTVAGDIVAWPMPAELPEGTYVVTWRVVSADGHPVSGGFSFGVGGAPVNGTGTADASVDAAAAPWPVVTIRLAGYVAFALFAGVVAFVMLCAPDMSKSRALQRLVRGGVLGGGAAAVAAILVQGPYTAGASISRAFDIGLISETLATPFGTAMMYRLALYGVVAVLVWRLPRILTGLASWVVPAGVASIAVTIGGAGHGAAAGPLDLGVHALHALAAGLWVGGLVALVVLRRSVEPRTLLRFSTLAMASVLTLVITGTLNSLSHLTDAEQLWQTRYGLTLLIKLALVATTLAVAAVSRRRLHQRRVPLRSVRVEAALTVTILVVTALLTMTAPPPQPADPTSHTAHGAHPTAADEVVQMSLGGQGDAALSVSPATTSGSSVRLILTGSNGQRLSASQVTLKVANPDRQIAPIPVPLTMQDNVWVATYRFPLPGTWKTVLTVDGIGSSAIVTSGVITIRD